ncbi:MAG: putative manganese-dependent inorganic diphosphatase [Clostridiales bacterium]|nr:putative manganese-dependent inorganic diphosphatase [Clostridiales bacterium]
MDPIYVCGHRNPDTDSIVSAMAYAALNNALGDHDYVPARLGQLNDESTFLLERFGFEPPLLLTTVRTQVRDIEYDIPPTIGRQVPVSHAWQILREHKSLPAVPVTCEDGSLYGMITAGSVAESDMESIVNPSVHDVPVFNLLSALEGHIVNSEEDAFDLISGEVVIALPHAGDPLRGMKEGAIVLCGESEDVIDAALARGASCIIICQGAAPAQYLGLHSKTCIMVTPCDAYRAARMIYQAIPVSRIAQTEDLVCFHLNDFIDDVRETVLQSRYRSYPIIDHRGHVAGTLSRYHLLRPKRKRVVLVDHNEKSQSIPGLDQAEIIAIIDHHRLADVQTGHPVFMRNEPVGSTTTIVATMFQERGLQPSEKLAGLMAAAILSDTVLFKSPTCTQRDKRMAERLARIAGIDLERLGREMFSAASSADKPAETLLNTDFKEFHIAGHALGISQITCLETDALLTRMDELLPAMNKLRQLRGYDMMLLMVTDVLRCGTELIFLGDEEIIEQAFGTGKIAGQHVFLPGVVSRKKQIVPALAVLWG